MNTSLALPVEYQERIRQQVLGAMIDMIPKDKMDEMIESQVRAFFDTKSLLALEETTVEIKNPEHGRDRWEGSSKRVPAMVVKSMMSPFTQMVWSMVYAAAQEQLTAFFAEKGNLVQQEFKKWFEEDGRAMADSAHGTQMAVAVHMMSRGLFQSVANAAVESTKMAMMNAAQNAVSQGLPLEHYIRNGGVR